MPYLLDSVSGKAVLDAIREVCMHRNRTLLAAHVRSTHVHAVVGAEIQPEPIMNAFKSYASRRLNRQSPDKPHRNRWARHGSTLWLWKDENVRQAIQYVVEEQGEAMAVFFSGRLDLTLATAPYGHGSVSQRTNSTSTRLGINPASYPISSSFCTAFGISSPASTV